MDGTPARGSTREEFRELIMEIEKAARGQRAKLQRRPPPPINWSWDNASWHDPALASGPFHPSRRLKLPPNSPDMHKVVEHAIGLLKHSFKKEFNKDRTIKTAKQAASLLHQVAHKVITRESIRKDVLSLEKTYRNIIESEGDWASQGLR
jgi:hypothetical protein